MEANYNIIPLSETTCKIEFEQTTPTRTYTHTIFVRREPCDMVSSGRVFRAYQLQDLGSNADAQYAQMLPLYIAAETLNEVVSRVRGY